MNATSWTLILVNALLIVLAYMARRSPRWKHWSWFQSEEVRDICSHLSEEEESALRRRTVRYGVVMMLTFVFPFSAAVGFPSPWTLLVAAVLITVYLIWLPSWSRSQK